MGMMHILDPRKSERLISIGIGILLTTATCLFFWKVLLLPHAFHIPYDIHGYHYPLAHEIFVGLKQGYLPLWDPYIYSGMPLAGNIQAQLFYPPTLLFIKLSDRVFGALPFRMMEYQLIFHYLLAGFFTYRLGRRFDFSRVAATLAAIIYAFGGFFASQAQHLGLINGAAWIPLIFYFIKRALDTRRRLYATGAGFALAMVILAGFPAMIIAAFFIVGLSGLILLAVRGPARDGRPGAFGMTVVALALVCALGLAAVQLAPTAELSRNSITNRRPFSQALGGFEPQAHMSLLAPGIYGAGTERFWGDIDHTFGYLYVGIAALILALIAVSYPKRREVLFISSLTIFSLLWMLGEAMPVSAWVWLITPRSVGNGIYPFCSMAFFDLGIALLAGFGLEALKHELRESERTRIKWVLKFFAGIVLIIITLSLILHVDIAAMERTRPERTRLITMTQAFHMAILMILFAGGVIYMRITGFLKGTAAAWLLVLVTVIDLFAAGSGKNFNTHAGDPDAYVSPTTMNGRADLLEQLKQDPDYQRGGFLRMDVHADWTNWNTVARLWRVENANGDDPLLPKSYESYRLCFSDLQGSREFALKDPSSRLLDLLNVKYLLVAPSITNLALPDKFRLIGEQPMRLYFNSGWLPRAFFVAQAIVEDNSEGVYHRLTAPDFDPRQYVVLEKTSMPPGHNSPSVVPAGEDLPVGESVQIVSYSPNEIIVRSDGPRNGFLVLCENFYPGWKAYVDGRPVEIIRANGIFRAVPLSYGQHSVAFRYEPRSLRMGAAISAVTLLAITLGWLFNTLAHRRRRQDSVTAPPPPTPA